MVSRDRVGLLDTSVVIDLDHVRSASELPDEPRICTITLAELSAGPLATSDEVERGARQQRVQFVEASFDPIPFGAQEARAFARVAASLRGVGRTPNARAFDALIAAVALANDLPVYTRNPGDFRSVSGLEVREVAVIA